MSRVWSILRAIVAFTLSAQYLPGYAADNYPVAPIRIVIGFPSGGPTDVIGRLLAQKLSSQMKANVVVENRPGANSNIATEFVAKSRSDGYTLLFNSSGVILSRALDEKLGYDILKDFTPVALFSSGSLVLLVHPSVPVVTVAEFIAFTKANPNKLAYGSGGAGSSTHLATLLFLQANGLGALHVPYKGSAPVLTDVVAGHIPFALLSILSSVPMVKTKRIKALAITTAKRSPLLPDVPTLAETVMPGFEVGTWFGMMAPANTPSAIVNRINGEIKKALQDPDMKSRLLQEGAEPLGSSPEEYGAYLKSELDRWTKLIKTVGIKSE